LRPMCTSPVRNATVPEGIARRSRKPTSAVSFWKIPRPPPYRGKIDIVDLLLGERQGER